MIRIISLLLALVVLSKSIRVYKYDKINSDESTRIVSFFLMVGAILIFLLTLNDSIHTIIFSYQIIRGELIHEPVWYPSRFPWLGQRTHSFDFVVFVVLSCAAVLWASRKREAIARRLSQSDKQ